MKKVGRRDFLKYGTGGLTTIVLGAKLSALLAGCGSSGGGAGSSPDGGSVGQTHVLEFTISDTIKEMVTHNAVNPAECYFWIYKSTTPDLPADSPGPTILAAQGDKIRITLTNNLDEPHAFAISDTSIDSGRIDPGEVKVFEFNVPKAGTYLYYDNLNEPVNRVMGLHGALVVMPGAKSGAKWTPYGASDVSPQVQLLFDELGTAHWPGLAWEQGKAETLTPPFRQYVWLLSQASPTLFRDVGSLPAGQIFSASLFVQRFRNDAFSENNHDPAAASDIPQYFTGMGQSGHFMHNNPVIVPMARVGEPVVIRVLNAGLLTHSMHIHANHFYMLSVDGVVQGAPVGNGESNATLTRPGPIWIDTFTANPWDQTCRKYDLLLPYMRPPDVPNVRGIGLADAPLSTLNGATTWPPVQEFDRRMQQADTALSSVDGTTVINTRTRQSPLCYPAHDHSEPSQTSQGGNYNCGVIGGQYFIGDQNIDLPAVNVTVVHPDGSTTAGPALPPKTFPMDEDFAMMVGLSQDPQILVYGIDEARRNVIGPPGRDTQLESQADRPPFPTV